MKFRSFRLIVFAFVLTCLFSCNIKAKANAPLFPVDFNDTLSDGTDYIMIVNGYDWGPAANKLVVNFGERPEQIPNDIVVKASYAGWTGSVTEERTVIDVYYSDAEGNKNEDGSFIAVELQVGPDLGAGNVFSYDMGTGLNNWPTTYSTAIYCASLNKTVGKCSNVICPQADQFLTGEYTTKDEVLLNDGLKNDTLTYAVWSPEEDDHTNAMIVWVHGAGEGGTDPYIELLGNRVVNLISDDVQKNFDGGAYVFAAQTPTVWMNCNGSQYDISSKNFTSMYTGTLMEMIDSYVRSNPDVDPDRIYIGGCSNGGYMTVNMIVNFPDYFAAAYPICEAYGNEYLSDEAISYLKNMPIWFTHATNDSTVPITEVDYNWMTGEAKFKYDDDGNIKLIDDFSRAAFRRLTEAGAADVHFSEFPDVHDTTGLYNEYQYMGHYSWIYTLKNECVEDGVSIFEWMSGKKLSDRQPSGVSVTPWSIVYDKKVAKQQEAAVTENEEPAKETIAEENTDASEELQPVSEKTLTDADTASANVNTTRTILIIVIISLFVIAIVAVFLIIANKNKNK